MRPFHVDYHADISQEGSKSPQRHPVQGQGICEGGSQDEHALACCLWSFSLRYMTPSFANDINQRAWRGTWLLQHEGR